MVRHPFVLALGEGTLPQRTFADYMVQDYLFIGALTETVASAAARVPDPATAKPLNDFLQSLAGAEEVLFRRNFDELGVPWPDAGAFQPVPAMERFCAFLVGLAHHGTFAELVTALFVTEGTYYDWATRLVSEGRYPDHTLYREWIDLHADKALGDFVAFLNDCMEAPSDSPATESDMERVFTTVLGLELEFWDAFWPAAEGPNATEGP